jgi:hypothetical protein
VSIENNTNGFEPLSIKRRIVRGLDVSRYNVRAASGEVREIKADTAYEAFRQCGLSDIIKIERIFSANGNIIEKSNLIEDISEEAQGEEAQDTLHDRVLKRKSAIITADELDEIMRAISAAPPVEPAPLPAPAQMPPAPASVAAPSPVPVPLPEPVETLAPQGVPSPIGMDVHGDGFDEIIPAAQAPMKHAAAKPAEHKNETPPAAADIPPERELSAEEVEKLLSGKL